MHTKRLKCTPFIKVISLICWNFIHCKLYKNVLFLYIYFLPCCKMTFYSRATTKFDFSECFNLFCDVVLCIYVHFSCDSLNEISILIIKKS